LRSNEAIGTKLGRAVRYNLCCVSLHRGFPLPSLTQNQIVLIVLLFVIDIEIAIILLFSLAIEIAIDIAIFIAFLFPPCHPLLHRGLG